jgi:predicted membrane-bound mannosyltransferase
MRQGSFTLAQVGARFAPAALLLLVFTASLSIRVWQLAFQPPHADELRQLRDITAPWTELLALSYAHQQPPLAYIIDKAVLTLSGTSDFWQRLPPAVFGSGAVALVAFALLRSGYGYGAILASIVLIPQPLLVEYSRYARPYMLPAFAAAAALVFYQEWHRTHRQWTVACFALTLTAALLSRPLMPLIFALLLGLVATYRTARRVRGRSLRARIQADPLALAVTPLAILVAWLPNYILIRMASGAYLRDGSHDLRQPLTLPSKTFRCTVRPPLLQYLAHGLPGFLYHFSFLVRLGVHS